MLNVTNAKFAMEQQVENPQPVAVTQSFEILFKFLHFIP